MANVVPFVLALVSAGTVLTAQSPVERDSAGIRIIENPSRAAAPVVFRLGEPVLDLGGPAENPDVELKQGRGSGALTPPGGLRLSDGTVAVPDAVRIQLFDARGRRAGMFGMFGAGPAEFRSLGPAEFCRTRGDTLIAGDYRNGRFAVIHGQSVVRTSAYSAQFGGGLAGCFDDGTILMKGGLPNFRTPTYTVRLNRLRLDGTLANDLGAERALNTQSPAFREMARGWQPDTYPAYFTVLVDPDGRLWVQDGSPRRTDRDGWTAFDSNGRLIGRLELPRMIGQRPAAVVNFGVNEVQVRQQDADGFYHLVFYPIQSVQR